MFERSSWIWLHNKDSVDEYAEFFVPVFFDGKEKVICRLSCDGDYTLFVGGRYVSSNQYGDFEHYKIYDEIDITKYLSVGENKIEILVWYFGKDSQRYKKAKAGLIFEIVQGQTVLAVSGENTLCRESKTYKSGYQKVVTHQLGFSFLYDATQENAGEFLPAIPVEKNCVFFPRPTLRLCVGERAETHILKDEGTYYLIDLGKETVGLPVLDFFSETKQKITVAWGEDLQNGHVRRIIDNRDFSFEYIAKKGKNEYANYMLRMGCRYLEVFAQNPIQVEYIGVLPQNYEVKNKAFSLEDKQEQAIYELCVHSLKKCLMEHYVDTPWREQCLYAFDSRNQMLCGYYAFENGNAEYARANLLLMSKDEYPSGLMSICYPCGADLTIPSFSLYYTLAVREYMENTGDYSIACEVMPRIKKYMDVFLAQKKNGLLCRFTGKNNWNFYDWTEYMEGTLRNSEEEKPDAPINMLAVMALKNLRRICELAGLEYPYQNEDEEIANAVKKVFFDNEKQAFSVTENGKEFTELVNAFAVVFGIVKEEEAKALCELLANAEFLPCTLSMKCFTYDALLLTDKEKWTTHVLDEIKNTYQKMLDAGASATWETADGASAFDNAGSLCHGWSAIPVYYYHLLRK